MVESALRRSPSGMSRANQMSWMTMRPSGRGRAKNNRRQGCCSQATSEPQIPPATVLSHRELHLEILDGIDNSDEKITSSDNIRDSSVPHRTDAHTGQL